MNYKALDRDDLIDIIKEYEKDTEAIEKSLEIALGLIKKKQKEIERMKENHKYMDIYSEEFY